MIARQMQATVFSKLLPSEHMQMEMTEPDDEAQSDRDRLAKGRLYGSASIGARSLAKRLGGGEEHHVSVCRLCGLNHRWTRRSAKNAAGDDIKEA